MNIKCNECGHWNSLGTKICDKCGKPLFNFKEGLLNGKKSKEVAE